MEKKVAIMLADGFEEVEALTVVDVLRRANIACDMISIGKEYVLGSHRIIVKADKLFSEIDKDSYEMIYLPGGHVGANNLRDFNPLIDWIRYAYQNEKYLVAICAAPIVLAKAGIIQRKEVTSYPDDIYRKALQDANYVDDNHKMEEMVVVSDRIITSRGPATALPLAYKLVSILGGDSERLRNGMLYNDLCDVIRE
jgi:4-methyl-5(b-hydroxyethyl)-thiazole monophosphate biosynthesis